MNYNDFPILTNDEYNLMNNYYKNNKPVTKPELINEILNHLTFSINTCVGLANKYNHTINNTLTLTKNNLEKLKQNIETLFNINSQNCAIHDKNIFTLLENILDIIPYLNNWLLLETKEYYKKFITKTLNEIINISKNILQSLNNSNIHFYKYM